jgi:uncharacterized protein (TIGR02246 family)
VECVLQRPEEIAVRFTDAWNRHDMAALAALFAEEADFVNVVGMWWRTRSEIEAAHAEAHATFFKDSHLEGEVAAVKLLRPDVAVVHVRWQLSGQLEPDGKTGAPRQGILVLVLTREAGGWRARVAQNTDILPGLRTIPGER